MSEQADGPDTTVDAVIVGAGFSGLYALYKMREIGLDAVVLERGSGVGGTWFWNRYPGARCDVPSVDYSYSFSSELEQEWSWTEWYPSQPEILQYLNHVADRFGLRRDIRLETRVEAAVYSERDAVWRVSTSAGARFRARYLLMATGMLSTAQLPVIVGMPLFRGPIYHTGNWPHEDVDFRGQTVGVIGTGSSGIQAIPMLAEQADQLVVFQRTPSYSIPAWNHPMRPDEQQEIKKNYGQRRMACRTSPSGSLIERNTDPALSWSPEKREAEYDRRWKAGGAGFMGAFGDLRTNLEANGTAAEYVQRQIRRMVADPAVADILSPRGLPIGTRRICVDTNYYETYNRPNVELVDVLRSPIVSFTERGVRTQAAEYELDAVVCATGFDAMTGALAKIDIRGRDGLSLVSKWRDGPRTYLGLCSAGFPNLFVITGPGSPSVLGNMVTSIEQHVEWTSELIAYAQARALRSIEADAAAEDEWVAHVNELASGTIYVTADSWYLGSNVPGKPRVFMPYVGGMGNYRRKCEDIASLGYPGFALQR